MRRMNPKGRPKQEKSITRIEKHLFRVSDPEYKELDELTFKSKNLYKCDSLFYEAVLFKNHYFPSYASVNKEFTHFNQPDDRALPAKVAKHTQMQADEACRSFSA